MKAAIVGGHLLVRHRHLCNKNAHMSEHTRDHGRLGDDSCGSATQRTQYEVLLDHPRDHGGRTQTMALLPGSAAIDAGGNNLAPDTNTELLTTDQRGAGFPRIIGGTVDVRAFEVAAHENGLDDDDDGVPNDTDNCPTVPNADQADTDADGVGDACDNCILIANGPEKPDAGGASQRDTNEKDYGNACDADLNGDGVVNFGNLAIMKGVFFTTDANADPDGDGVVNFEDLAIMKKSFFKKPGPAAGEP